MTRAFIDILHCNFIDAFNDNPLIFIILPVGIFYIYVDFMKFRRRLKSTDTTHYVWVVVIS